MNRRLNRFLDGKAQNIAASEPYKVYGKAASTMDDAGFAKKVGSYNNRAGAKGERLVFEKLRSKGGWLPADTPLFCSLSMKKLGKNSDVDFAVVRGNKVLLIDAKMYRQDGGFYWNLPGNRSALWRNFSPYKTKNGEYMELSKSMIMAKDIISRQLPGFDVESVVIMTTDSKNKNAKVPTTWAVKYPGNVTVLNDNNAARYIRKFLGGQERTTDTYNAERFLRKLVQ